MTSSTRFAAGLLGATALAAILSSGAQAATLVGLTGDNQLVTIDTATMMASSPVKLMHADRVVGIDMRPADGKIYGLTAAHDIVSIDPKTGAVAKIGTLSEKPALGARPVVDFNPVADRLRVIAEGGVSLRIAVETGATTVDKPLSFDPADAHAGKKPVVAAGAYTNAVAGAKATELVHIEGVTGALVLQSPPNDGILKTRGATGIAAAATVAMDILSGPDGANTAYVVSGQTLHTLDLASGKPTTVGAIKGLTATLVDIAAMAR